MPAALSVSQALNRASKAIKTGEVEVAEDMYLKVLERFPANRRARQGLEALCQGSASEMAVSARDMQARGKLYAAEKRWTFAVCRSPETAGLGIGLALCRLEMGQAAAALDAIDKVLEVCPDDARALDTRGRALRDLGRMDEAETCHRAALRGGIEDTGPLNHLGILAQARGERDAAAGFYRQAIALRPEVPDLHHNLSHVLTYTEGEPHVDQMQRLLARVAPRDPGQAPLHFALFKAFDDLDQRDRAFAHLAQGNRMKQAAVGYEVRHDALRFAHVKSLLAKPLPPLDSGVPLPARPIFVVGLPRSGTTLVEQVLAQAPGTQACGELSVVARAAAKLLRTLQDEKRKQLDTDDIADLRAQIAAGLSRYSNGAPVMIDKMPLNFRWVGFIAAALPEARIVHVSRDPMSVAWSLYRHAFAGRGNGFAYGIGEIVAYMLLHRDLMAFWQARLSDRLITLNYDEMVRAPETRLRELVDRCGLGWRNDCLAAHRSNNAVLTASSAQVRQPIHDGSNAAWRRYEAQLAPLRDALSNAGLI
ncbi:MAG: sulfotransferase [Pseudooceanicola sp.]|nr:sulfotransferase [Pseudooceanicola sp.]